MTVITFPDQSEPMSTLASKSGTLVICNCLRAAAEAWFRENDPEVVAFEYDVQTN
jgi:hypothetical protein